MLQDIMNIIGWIATLFGTPSALCFIFVRLKNRKNISWRNVKKGIKCLAEKVEKIKPDCIITFSGRGAIVTSLVITELDNKYPVYMCLLKRRYNEEFFNPQNWPCFTTSKWIIYVPDEVLAFNDKKILVIDDLTNSGETISKLIEHLVEQGLSKEKIFSMSLVANESILASEHIPQEYWKKLNISEYNVPWGKTEING